MPTKFIYSYLIIELPRNYTIKCFKIFKYQYFSPVLVTFLVNAIFYILLSKIIYIKNKFKNRIINNVGTKTQTRIVGFRALPGTIGKSEERQMVV